ncbi:MAG: divergent polysaccharide deacetylase family protein [PVC group bacterium]|nr:divergent polysaccharide deacetylase family protein [PVC group bacterium]
MTKIKIIIITVIIATVVASFFIFQKKDYSPPTPENESIPEELVSEEKTLDVKVAKLAIVLDDWGYNKAILKDFLALNTPMTCSILPHLPYSADIANRLHKLKYEFILHLPMEPYNADQISMEKNTILTTMNSQQITKIIQQAITNIPHLKGANNHMGSKATADETIMNIVLTELKNNGLFFLDSYVDSKSVGRKVAQAINISFLKRDVFIDNNGDAESIRQQLEQAKIIALGQGQAIAIGHAKPTTMSVLAKTIPEFKKEGITFVYLSELLD